MLMSREWLIYLLGVLKNVTLIPQVDTPNLHLFKNDIVPNQDTAVGDFVEADFDGYAASAYDAGDWNIGIDPVSGLIIYEPKPGGAVTQWEVSGETNIPQTIYGAYLTNAADTKVVMSRRFSTPITLTSPATSLVVRIDRPIESLFDPATII